MFRIIHWRRWRTFLPDSYAATARSQIWKLLRHGTRWRYDYWRGGCMLAVSCNWRILAASTAAPGGACPPDPANVKERESRAIRQRLCRDDCMNASLSPSRSD